jgi:hypothetical protein
MKKLHFNKISLLFLSVFTLTVFATPTISPTNTNSSTKSETIQAADHNVVPTYLFVQAASKAKIEINKKVPNTYKVTLEGVSPDVTYFSERPNRVASTMPIERFLKIWNQTGNNSFREDAPNADFNGIQAGFFSSAKPFNAVLELSQPTYDSKTKTLTYTAKALEGSASQVPDSATLKNVVLFIDDACFSCWH